MKTSKLVARATATIAATMFIVSPAPVCAQGGVPLWTNRYPSGEAAAIAVDSNGNVFVTGTCFGTNAGRSAYLTLKYSSAGLPLWTNYYDVPGSSEHHPRGIAVDSSGDVVVTGSSAVYDGMSSPDYLTIKYSNSGVPLWTNRYDGPAAKHDVGAAITVDGSGNVLVTGKSADGVFPGSAEDFTTVKYSSAGMPLWTQYYDGPASLADSALAVAVDSSGNVFVAGYSWNTNFPGIESDYVTIKYSSDGDLLWINTYDDGDYSAVRLAVDGNGNAFVTGRSWNGSNDDFATIAYSNDGVLLWAERYNGPANGNDVPRAIAVDTAGNVFVTGLSEGIGTRSDYATIKYSTSGVPLWTNRFNGPGNSSDFASAITVDHNGNVFVTGSSNATNNFADCATIAYSNAGVPLWTNRYNGPANLGDNAGAIAVDNSGNVFVTGSSSNGTNNDFVTIKYSSSVPPPRLDFQKLNNEMVLSWTNAGFHLQTAPAVTGPFTNLPGATTPYTNPISAPQQFFRLKLN